MIIMFLEQAYKETCDSYIQQIHLMKFQFKHSTSVDNELKKTNTQ